MKIEEVNEKHIGITTMLISHKDGYKPYYIYGKLSYNSNCKLYFHIDEFEKGIISPPVRITHVVVT